MPLERPEQRERGGIETGDARRVGVARSAPATLGEEHHRQSEPLDEIEEAVLLLVVHLALGARQHAVVVGEHGAARLFGREQVAVHPGEAGDQPVRRRVGYQVVAVGVARAGLQ